MRKQIVAGNWKMNKNYFEGIELIKEILKLLKDYPPKNFEYTHIIFGTPYIHLFAAAQLIKGDSRLHTAAQNCYTEEKGAYTGEISANMIKSTGTDFVIIGHSERRQYFKESNEMLAKKVNQALSNQLFPIFCCGEVLYEREKDNHHNIVREQLEEGVFHLDKENFKKTVIAYEPVWAIGTGKTATPGQAQEMHQFIRKMIEEKYNKTIAGETSILYGGSCKPSNAKKLFEKEDIDGGLIGGASLKADDFVDIIKAL